LFLLALQVWAIEERGNFMCRLFAITSTEPLSPMVPLRAIDVMKEGHDGSGVGLFMTDLGGEFENFKSVPVRSPLQEHPGGITI
jgi:hypothetical protein